MTGLPEGSDEGPGGEQGLGVLLVSDTTTGNLASALRARAVAGVAEIREAPFGQVLPTLMGLGEGRGVGEGPGRPDVVIVWVRPEGASAEYARAVQHDPEASAEGAVAEVQELVAAVKAARRKVPHVLVASFSADPLDRGLGILDLAHRSGAARIRLAMNHALVEGLAGEAGVLVLDSERWVAAADGGAAVDPRLWYMAKVPFGPAVVQIAADEFATALGGLHAGARKLLVLDLDQTLWGGIVGETGPSGIRLGGHDPVGEAFVDFQRAVKALSRRGVVLGIVSKNEEAVALEALESHPEMVLRPDDFAGWRINWQDKAANVASLVEELNLGLDSAVFVDDQPAERGRVRDALPQVLVPDWPSDPLLYRRALRALRCFDTPALSDEDRLRARSYAAERRRREVRSEVSSPEEWLQRLQVQVGFEALSPSNLDRASQLLNRTNQMNLRTRRMSAPELEDWAAGEGRVVWLCRVSDRFGDAGITGLLSLEVVEGGDTVDLADFVLSCRVFGRRVEETMVARAMAWAGARGASVVQARFRTTERNRPCLRFWEERSGFRADGRSADDSAPIFRRPVEDRLEPPATVSVDPPHEEWGTP